MKTQDKSTKILFKKYEKSFYKAYKEVLKIEFTPE